MTETIGKVTRALRVIKKGAIEVLERCTRTKWAPNVKDSKQSEIEKC
jgi:hypothetical protein